MIKKITEKEFEEIKNHPLVLIDFSAEWCTPCNMLKPILEELSNEYQDRMEFYNVDVDEEKSLAYQFNVHSFPTVIILKNGQINDTSLGFKPKILMEPFIIRNLEK